MRSKPDLTIQLFLTRMVVPYQHWVRCKTSSTARTGHQSTPSSEIGKRTVHD